MYHQEHTLLHAHPARSTYQLVVESQGVPGLQSGVLQRVAEPSEGHPGGWTGKGEDGHAVLGGPCHDPGTALEDERLAPASHHGGLQAYPLGGEQDVRDGEEGAELTPG